VAEPLILQTKHIELRFVLDPWLFAQQRSTEITEYFASLQRKKPSLWNGQILMLREHVISDGVFRGTCFPVAYASFLAWRDWGFPDNSANLCVAHGALQSTDGAFLLGVMAAHTASAGRVYFPAGPPDPRDVINGSVDFEGSMRREIAEETGLTYHDFLEAPLWRTGIDGPIIGHFKVLSLKQNAKSARERILIHLASEPTPELADIRADSSHVDA
jgi:hypothetical protein